MPRSHIDRFVLAILVTASATILVFISRNGYTSYRKRPSKTPRLTTTTTLRQSARARASPASIGSFKLLCDIAFRNNHPKRWPTLMRAGFAPTWRVPQRSYRRPILSGRRTAFSGSRSADRNTRFSRRTGSW